MSDRTTSPIIVRRPAWIDEFRAFIMRGNVVDLAYGRGVTERRSLTPTLQAAAE